MHFEYSFRHIADIFLFEIILEIIVDSNAVMRNNIVITCVLFN